MVLGPLIRCHISPNDLKGTGFKNPLSTSASISVRCNSTRTEQSPLRRRGTKASHPFGRGDRYFSFRFHAHCHCSVRPSAEAGVLTRQSRAVTCHAMLERKYMLARYTSRPSSQTCANQCVVLHATLAQLQHGVAHRVCRAESVG